MSAAESVGTLRDPYHVGHAGESHARGHGSGGPASKRVIVGYGFWLFLLSDIVVFSCLFAAYAVLADATAGGPSARQIFELDRVSVETACLLASSFTCGLASIAVARRSQLWTQVSLIITGLLGLAFLLLEASEFAALYAKDDGPTRSAFLTGFYTLVGCHGLHVSVGLLWLGTMMAQLFAKGFRADIRRRFLCFTMFWHFLDIIWVAIFSLVYLVGTKL
ncbi:MAG TPA: cytochrome (ubi)quinol oxidase subunit III [Rhizomicrobium sp.]|jgi:cytochrome o ubiquinol oxidase subunit 3